MGNEHIGQIQLILQILHQVQNLCLNGHVQSGNRLITYDEFGLQCQCTGNSDTLSSSAVQLMGVGVGQTLCQTHQIHQLMNSFPKSFLILLGVNLLNQQGLHNRLADSHSRVQGCEGVLKDNLHFPS